MVAGEALQALDTEGHFVLPSPSVDGPYAILSRAEAARIAEGVLRTWITNPDVITPSGLGNLKEGIEEGHGGPIAWEEVRASSRDPYFAESHLDPLPASLGAPTVRHFGPQYLAPFYVGPEPVLVVAVSAYATNVFLNADGFVERTDPLDGGGEFWTSGIPITLEGVSTPPSPEVAVEFAYQQTGVRVVEVPVLGALGHRIAPPAARWRVRLAKPVRVKRLMDGQEVTTDVLFVGTTQGTADARMVPGGVSEGFGLRLLVAAAEQPETQPLGDADLPVQEGYALELHEVRVVGAQPHN
jgi:hypothetical protein